MKENNLEKQHRIPVNSLVEISGDDYDGLRLWVVEYTRDCDGTPLYTLSFSKEVIHELVKLEEEKEVIQKSKFPEAYLAMHWMKKGKILGNFSENSLTVIK